MFPTQLMGLTWPALEERVERSGRWSSWVAAETVLAALNGLDEVVAIVEDRGDPVRADALLAALVRLGAVDGGNDQDAAQAVALLLANGAGQLARQLGNLDGLLAPGSRPGPSSSPTVTPLGVHMVIHGVALHLDEEPELFFPEGTTAPAMRQTEQAKAVCRRCEVAAACLTWAIKTGRDAGVWGGQSEGERHALKLRSASLRRAS